MENERGKTNWYVITGGPGSGKTTTVNLLRERGYSTTIEHARHYLYTQSIKGRTVEEVRKNQTIGEARMIIYSWYRMNLLLKPVNNGSEVMLSITYEKPKGWFSKIISFFFADWYCNWCLKNMLDDMKKNLEK